MVVYWIYLGGGLVYLKIKIFVHEAFGARTDPEPSGWDSATMSGELDSYIGIKNKQDEPYQITIFAVTGLLEVVFWLIPGHSNLIGEGLGIMADISANLSGQAWCCKKVY